MKKAGLFLLIIAVGLFQATLLNYLRLFNVKPDLLLVCAILASVTFELRWAIFFSILSGLIKDSLSAGIFGINIILFALWSIFIIQLSKNIDMEEHFMRIGILSAIVLFNNIISGMIIIYSGVSLPLGIFLRVTIINSLYTVFSFPFIYRILKPYLTT